MQTKNEIIADLFKSKEFNDCIKKMQPVELQDDLKAEVALILCEHKEQTLLNIVNSGPMSLKYYTVRIILNLIKSKTSPFYKKYRRPITEFNDTHDKIAEVTKEEYNERLLKELREENVMQIIEDFPFYEREMLKLYMELGSYRLMSKATLIPWASCYDAVQMSINKIKYELRKRKSV